MNGSSTPPPIKKFRCGDNNHVTTTTTEEDSEKDKKKEIYFTGFPVITKLPWELPNKKWEGMQIPPGWPEEDGQVIYVDKMGREHIYYDDHRNYHPNEYPYKIRTPYIKEEDDDSNPPPTIVEFDPNQYPYTCKPETLDRYYAQLKESEGFDVDPIPGVHMYSLTVPMDHLGAEKKQCELVARMAVDEYNRRYKIWSISPSYSLLLKDDKGELKFGKIIKVMVKVVAGFLYYLTVEAINLSSEMPVTFQAVVFTGVSKDEVESFRFISDAKKEPWLWKDDDICTSMPAFCLFTQSNMTRSLLTGRLRRRSC